MSAETVFVGLRVRPVSEKEKGAGSESCVRVRSSTGVTVVDDRESPGIARDFNFHKVFDQDQTQEALYDCIGKPIVEKVLTGYNGTIFAYGQTGSGKTHSMEGIGSGNSSERGIIPRAIEQIFKTIEANSEGEKFSYLVRASYLELYNEELRDLLVPTREREKLEIHEDPEKGVYVKNQTYKVVESAKALLDVFLYGKKNRMVAATAMNETSSRSHSLFSITIERSGQAEEGSESIVSGTLLLCDLAGSERQSRAETTGLRLREGININLSLVALGGVISALVEAAKSKDAGTNGSGTKSRHIPYRDSKLTRLLQQSLGNNAVTAMLACVGPCDREETLSTLRYASRAKKIQNTPVVNEDPKDALLRSYQAEIAKLRLLLGDAERFKDIDMSTLQALLSRSKDSSNSNSTTDTASTSASTAAPSSQGESVGQSQQPASSIPSASMIYSNMYSRSSLFTGIVGESFLQNLGNAIRESLAQAVSSESSGPVLAPPALIVRDSSGDSPQDDQSDYVLGSPKSKSEFRQSGISTDSSVMKYSSATASAVARVAADAEADRAAVEAISSKIASLQALLSGSTPTTTLTNSVNPLNSSGVQASAYSSYSSLSAGSETSMAGTLNQSSQSGVNNGSFSDGNVSVGHASVGRPRSGFSAKAELHTRESASMNSNSDLNGDNGQNFSSSSAAVLNGSVLIHSSQPNTLGIDPLFIETLLLSLVPQHAVLQAYAHSQKVADVRVSEPNSEIAIETEESTEYHWYIPAKELADVRASVALMGVTGSRTSLSKLSRGASFLLSGTQVASASPPPSGNSHRMPCSPVAVNAGSSSATSVSLGSNLSISALSEKAVNEGIANYRRGSFRVSSNSATSSSSTAVTAGGNIESSKGASSTSKKNDFTENNPNSFEGKSTTLPILSASDSSLSPTSKESSAPSASVTSSQLTNLPSSSSISTAQQEFRTSSTPANSTPSAARTSTATGSNESSSSGHEGSSSKPGHSTIVLGSKNTVDMPQSDKNSLDADRARRRARNTVPSKYLSGSVSNIQGVAAPLLSNSNDLYSNISKSSTLLQKPTSSIGADMYSSVMSSEASVSNAVVTNEKKSNNPPIFIQYGSSSTINSQPSVDDLEDSYD